MIPIIQYQYVCLKLKKFYYFRSHISLLAQIHLMDISPQSVQIRTLCLVTCKEFWFFSLRNRFLINQLVFQNISSLSIFHICTIYLQNNQIFTKFLQLHSKTRHCSSFLICLELKCPHDVFWQIRLFFSRFTTSSAISFACSFVSPFLSM